MQQEIENTLKLLPPIEYTYNEIALLFAILKYNIKYCKYKGMNAVYRKLSETHILVCYFIGKPNQYTNTRKLQILRYIDNEQIPFDKTYSKLINTRMYEFYCDYLPEMERMLYKSKINSQLDISDDLSDNNDNIFKYELHINKIGNPTIRFNYDI